MVINMIVSDAAARGNMMTDLMRWYEGEAFPKYVPAATDTLETGTTKDFSAAGIVTLQRAPRSHLCHASVSDWCAANGVSAGGADKKARCARLTADVAGKVATMVNTYLAGTGTYAVTPIDSASGGCLGCHPATSMAQPVASGMACTTCHSDKTVGHPPAILTAPRSAALARGGGRSALRRRGALGRRRAGALRRGRSGALGRGDRRNGGRDVRADEPDLLLLVQVDRVPQDLERDAPSLRLGHEHLLVLEDLVVLEEALQLAQPVRGISEMSP